MPWQEFRESTTRALAQEQVFGAITPKVVTSETATIAGDRPLEDHAEVLREVKPRSQRECLSLLVLVLACLCPCHSKSSRTSTTWPVGWGWE